MCGIAGIWQPDAAADPQALLRKVTKMTDAIRHRGPDAHGYWSDAGLGLGLGHRRLSILDLSEAGAQPMHGGGGRYVLVFNGEIYNHLALRADLEATDGPTSWAGHSDTETLLALIARRGLADALRAARGMFALALWDVETRTLSLARDRMGEKPLLYSRTGNIGWAFASELGALRHGLMGSSRLSGAAVEAFLALGHVPDDLCILDGVAKVPPGAIVELRPGEQPAIWRFETFETLAKRGRSNGWAAGFDAASLAVENALLEVVEDQRVSDVPLGCFLSGGVDSSLIAAMMQAGRPGRTRTFSVGFDDPRFNEAKHAAAVAAHLNTEHHEIIVSETNALDLAPGLASIYDEPFADPSQIPTVLLCRAAREEVTVALSGDGGDEVFGGYNRHVFGPKLWRIARRIPRGGRWLGASLVTTIEQFVLPEGSALRRAGACAGLPLTALDKLSRLAPGLAESRSLDDLHLHFLAEFPNPGRVLAPKAGRGARARLRDRVIRTDPWLAGLSDAERMMARDTTGYLPGDILVKVDRAAMAASLETRAPFLDARIVELAWRLPADHRIRDGRGKAILRDVLDRHVPRELIDRPKQGFAIPLDRWMREGLASWAGPLLENADLLGRAGIAPDRVAHLWNRHCSCKSQLGGKLYAIAQLAAWLEKHPDVEPPAAAAEQC